MIRIKYFFAKIICRFLPPIVSQSVRNQIISIKDGEVLNKDFIKRSFTGSKFYGSTRDFHAFKFSVHGYFDWRNIIIAKSVLKFKEGAIIEVGANIGTETISFSDIAKKYNTNVFAFEPVPSNYESLVRNKEVNHLNNLILFNTLVAEKTGKTFFNIPEGNNSGSGHISNKSETNSREFEVVTLDGKLNNKKIALISVDVEGFEYQVLKGSEGLLKDSRPSLILEVNKKYLKERGGIEVENFYEYLSSFGYHCFYIERLGLEKVDIKNFKHKSSKNWLCIHKQEIHKLRQINNSIFFNCFNPCL